MTAAMLLVVLLATAGGVVTPADAVAVNSHTHVLRELGARVLHPDF
jgi:hypothetical protein